MNSNEAVEFAERMQRWHGARTKQARDIQTITKTGTTVRLQGESADKVIEVVLTEREVRVFRMGMEAALACFEKLPFEMHCNGGAGQAQTGG